MSSIENIIIITPVRNEGEFFRRMIDSMLRQTVWPLEWILVDDGSSDDTPIIAEEVASKWQWIRVIKRCDRGHREVGGGVVDAINDGIDAIEDKKIDFLGKFDGDLILKETYIENLLMKFIHDDRLGIASGIVVQGEGGRNVQRRCVREFAYGPARIWRKQCFDDIGGLYRNPAWDSLDCYAAMMRNWKTWVFDDPDLEIDCLRRIGSSDKSLLHGYLRDGKSAHFRKDHPLYLVASCLYRMADSPYLICGIFRLLGYLIATWKKLPQCSNVELANFLREWQLNRLVKTFKKA
jgi:glycosyltransferase involved in cell wall biosynthesis